MSKIRALIIEIHRRSLWQVLGIYAVGSWVVYQVVLGVYEGVGLPNWVPATALVLLLVGLPIVLATAFVQEGPRREGGETAGAGASGRSREDGRNAGAEAAARVATVATTPGGSGEASGGVAVRKGIFTWHRAITGGVLAFAALGLAATGFMGMRTLGIGPAATLVSAGVLDERERVLLAEFESASGDTVLAAAVTEALRVDLESSPTVSLVQASHVEEALRRMRRDPAAPLTSALATELATREGIRAILVGDVTTAGRQIVLTARLVGPDGRALASVRQTAGPEAVIEAADRLSAALRERLGESLKSIRAAEPLAQVTTSSLDALRKYSQGLRAFATEPDARKAIVLLEEAVAHDSTFSMAWRKLGIAYQNVSRDSMVAAIERAYRHRERLSDRERYLTEGTYFDIVAADTARAILAYQTLLDLYRDDETALHNLARLHSMRGEVEKAAELYGRAIEVAPYQSGTYRNRAHALARLRRYDELDSLLTAYEQQFPGHFQGPQFRGALAALRFRYDEALPLLSRAAEMRVDDVGRHELRSILLVQGRHAAERKDAREDLSDSSSEASIERDDAFTTSLVLAFHRFDPAAAVERFERFATETRLRSMPPPERPYMELVYLNLVAGRLQRAERLLEQWRRERPEDFERMSGPARTATIEMAAAKGEPAEAVSYYRKQASEDCLDCWFHLGRVYEGAGKPDSAIVAYETYLDPPRSPLFRVNVDRWWLPGTLQRLAALHEDGGNEEAAARYYAQFVDLWENADAELQPRVVAARSALARLAAER